MCAGILLMRWGAVISVLLFNNLQNCCSYRPFRRLDGNGDLRWEKIKSLDKGQIYKQVCNEKNVHWPLWHLIYLTAVVFTHYLLCSECLMSVCGWFYCFRETYLTSSDWQGGEDQKFCTLEIIFIATWLWVSEHGDLIMMNCRVSVLHGD